MSGHLFIISGASGTGKTTLCRQLEKELGLFFSISATTRPARTGEIDGRDYHFLTEGQFQEMKSHGKFLETARVHDYWYGTPREPIERHLQLGEDVLLDLDTQGGLNLKATMPKTVLIFIKPPSLEDLHKRLKIRATDSDEVIAKRIQRAREEMEHSSSYDYVVVNEDLSKAREELKGIIQSHR